MQISFRELQPSEAVIFADLIAETELGSHYRPDDPSHRSWVVHAVNRYFAAGGLFIAAFENGGHAVGYAVLLVDDKPGFRCKGEIVSLGVLPEYRRQGIGTALVRHCLDVSRELGLYCCYVATYAGDARAVGFYLHCGLVPVATLPDVHGPGDEGQVYLRAIVGSRDWRP